MKNKPNTAELKLPANVPTSAHPFDRDYFHGGAKVGGYAREGYWDYPVHFLTAAKIKELKPESVLEIGAARGYVLRRLEDAGIRVKGLEISEHCRLTRAIEDIVTWDITKTPWPIGDKEFDLGISIAVLEHIPEEQLGAIFGELTRTCKRGLHGIDLHDDDHFDKTHCSIHDLDWWTQRLPEGQVGVDKEDLERGNVEIPQGTGVKLNIGSFTTMFHHNWRNIDKLDLSQFAQQYGYRFVHHDVLAGLPFDENVVDLIFAGDFLNSLTYNEGAQFLAECKRTLKPGGILRAGVPDARNLLNAYSEPTSFLQTLDELNPAAKKRTTTITKLWEHLCADRKSMYDWRTLRDALQAASFSAVEHAKFRKSKNVMLQHETLDLYPDVSLIVEATK